MFRFLFFLLVTNFVYAQHEPKAWIVGLNTNTTFSNLSNLGGSLQVNYAYNCYTTYVNEISVFTFNNQTAYEVASSVNLILNNFKASQFILTGGIGLTVTHVTLSASDLEDSFLNISTDTNETHLGVLGKIRGLYQFKPGWNWVNEINLKTLGSNFINFSTGFNYEFPYRR